MLKPIKNEGETLICHHWKTFPPVTAHRPLEEQRDEITTEQYQRHQVWERICGLRNGMEASVCLDCPHVRKVIYRPNLPPRISSLDGKLQYDAVDVADIQSMGGPRGHLMVKR